MRIGYTNRVEFAQCAGYQVLSVGATAVGLDPTKFAGRIIAVQCYVENGPVRVRVDGTAPDNTTPTGVIFGNGGLFELSVDEAGKLLAIRSGVTNGLLHAFFYLTT